MARRRGRPPKAGPRYDCGKLRHGPDRGTTESQAKRRALVGAAADPALAEHPLGVLLARDLVTLEQFEAGLRYSTLRASAIGRVDPAGTILGRLVKSDSSGTDASSAFETDDEHDARISAAYDAADRALRDAGRGAREQVRNVCLYRRMPSWAARLIGGSATTRPSDARRRAELIAGLDSLVTRFGLVVRQAN